VDGHSLGAMVTLVYAARHPGHAGALVLQSAMGRFDLDRIVAGFRRAGGDEATAVAERVYGGESRSVTPEEWAPTWRLVGRWVPSEEERARRLGNRELNAIGLELMHSFDVLDQLGRIACPTLVCVGEVDPSRRWPPHRRSSTLSPKGAGGSRLSRARATSPGRTRPSATGRSS
jgi:pimeloyl-ACP methyl ester carboxylesterase